MRASPTRTTAEEWGVPLAMSTGVAKSTGLVSVFDDPVAFDDPEAAAAGDRANPVAIAVTAVMTARAIVRRGLCRVGRYTIRARRRRRRSDWAGRWIPAGA